MICARHIILCGAVLLWAQASYAQPPAEGNPATADGTPDTGDEPAPITDEQGNVPVEAKAWVDKAVATTGDIITYTVEITYDPIMAIELPEPGADIAGLRILDFGAEEPKKREGAIVERRWYKLRADLVGSYVLPPVKVHYAPLSTAGEAVDAGEAAEKRTLETSQIFIEVASVLPADGEATDIREIKPLYPSKRTIPWWVLTAGALGGALLIAGLLYWLMRRKNAVVIPPTPPHVIAFAALDALRQTDFADLEAIRQYYFRISEVLRAYIEGTFELNATDLTTEEILPRLLELPQLGPKEHTALGEFLRHTDKVKFAEHRPSTDEIQSAYEHALGFVEATMPHPTPQGAV